MHVTEVARKTVVDDFRKDSNARGDNLSFTSLYLRKSRHTLFYYYFCYNFLFFSRYICF